MHCNGMALGICRGWTEQKKNCAGTGYLALVFGTSTSTVTGILAGKSYGKCSIPWTDLIICCDLFSLTAFSQFFYTPSLSRILEESRQRQSWGWLMEISTFNEKYCRLIADSISLGSALYFKIESWRQGWLDANWHISRQLLPPATSAFPVTALLPHTISLCPITTQYFSYYHTVFFYYRTVFLLLRHSISLCTAL